MKDNINSSELDALIDACLDSRLSEAEAERLSQWIEESSEARKRYWEMASVHGLIEQSMQNASLKAATGEEFVAPHTKPKGLFPWRRITEIAAGITIGIFSASLVWAYKAPAVKQSQREKSEILFESFEDPSIEYSARFPKEAGAWYGSITTVAPSDGVQPMRGNYVAKLSAVPERKFSYARRILDLSALPTVGEGKNREVEVQASFFSLNTEQPNKYQIRLAVFSEEPEDVRPIWNDESILFDRVLRHVGKNHVTDASGGDWHKMRASVEIPPGARCVVVSLAIADVGRDSTHSEHYLDAIRFRLIESPTISE